MTMARTSLVGVLALAFAALSSAVRAEAQGIAEGSRPSCTAPDPHTAFVDDPTQRAGFVRISRKTIRGTGRTLQWVAVLFEGPPSGSVYVFDCHGRRLADVELGEVEHMTAGPRVGGHPTLQVLYVPGTGTGVSNWEDVALLQFRDGKITTLWTHPSTSDSSDAATGFASSERYRWKYLNRGSTILVTGTESEADSSTRPARHASSTVAERYCLTASSSRYVACPAPQKAKDR